MSQSVLERLRVYKQVCQKIRTSLVAGREEVVSPRTVSRSFMDSFEKLAPASSTDSGIFPEDGAMAGDSPVHSCECPFVEPAEGWVVEYSEKQCQRCSSSALCSCPHPPPSLELRPLAESAYRQHFYQQEHWNYFTEEPDIGPCILSIKQQADTESFRLLVRSSDHYLHGVVGAGQLGVCRYSREEVVTALGRELGLASFFKPAQFPSIQQELLKIDETFVKSHHKVGVLRVKQGQSSEEEIFATQHQPGQFDEFLNVLGKRVSLHGFKGFLGGLDSDRDLTGQHSVFTEFSGLEVMFHVAPLIPFTPNDPQQVNKKRHIGNDIVCIVFLDNAQTVFSPSWVRSHFIHCYIVVQHVVGAHGQPLYKVAVATRSTVPVFPPDLRHVGLFAHSHTLHEVLLAKAINAERASYHAPKFLKLTNRSRAQLLLEFTASLTEYAMACKQGRATRKISRRSNWLPIGASRPPSPMMDSVREKFSNSEKLAEDFSVAFRGCELADVVFIVGEDHMPLYAVKAILACRSRVFRTMFKETLPQVLPPRLMSPMVRRRATGPATLSPQCGRKTKSKLPGIGRRKKNSTPDLTRSGSPDIPRAPFSFQEDPRHMQIKEQYVIEGFNEEVFGELLNYLLVGSCAIRHSNVVGLACAAERYEVEELKQACFEHLLECLTTSTICGILSQLEKYLSYSAAKTMVVQSLEFVDSNAAEILCSQHFLGLSEHMVHLVMRRDMGPEVPELLKVKAAFDWGKLNTKPEQEGQDFRSLVTPLVKHVRLHLIDPQDIMKVLAPSGIFDAEKLMAALAYQIDPQSVEIDDFTMFRPRKKSTVLSSR